MNCVGAERKRVLVVDDDADTREMTAELLVVLGHDVRTAATGNEALAALDAFWPDVAFVDIGLPDISGHEVAARMRAVRPLGTMVIVALSGRSQAADIERSVAAGMDMHLVKPIGYDSLRRVVGDARPPTPRLALVR
jgi:CheY-like chemotaxis protein